MHGVSSTGSHGHPGYPAEYVRTIRDVTYAWASKVGDGGTRPPAVKKSEWDVPPEIMICLYLFLDTYYNFAFPTFKKKWPKSEEKLNFGG